jgi:hypothetical protein
MIPETLAPHIEGTARIQSQPDEFLRAFEHRVQAGLLTGYPHSRSVYRAFHVGRGHLHVSAATWWTAANVGLNELDLVVAEPGAVHYRVWYWRWARFVLILSGTLGAIGLVLLQVLDVRGYIARHMSTMISGLTVDQNLQVAWSMVLFWGFIAPWLLIAFHKRPVRRLVARLIAEVDRSPRPSSESAP